MLGNPSPEIKPHKGPLYAGVVWILSAIALTLYGVMGLMHTSVPGVEELVALLSKAEGTYIYLAAFVSILIEGLYFVGSFFPGVTLVIILAILSQISGTAIFLITILTIFVGWCIAGGLNIIATTLYRSKIIRLKPLEDYEVKDRVWTTWYPAFRANYEVSQIAEGGDPFKVFFSSVRVKVWASLAAAVYALVIPFLIDIHEVSNEEGFMSLGVVALISLTVGVMKIKNYYASQ